MSKVSRVDSTGKNTKKIKQCIVNQLKEDKLAEQKILDKYSFTGSKDSIIEIDTFAEFCAIDRACQYLLMTEDKN